MRAALFTKIGDLPEVMEIPDPAANHGDVVVDVVAAPVLPYAGEVFSGKRPMLFELPFVPGTGAVGRIKSVGAGNTTFKDGDWVYCDPTLRARDGSGLAAISLQGLTAGGPEALPLQRQYAGGSWAEQLRLPLENVVALGNMDPGNAPAWLAMGSMLVPYGGLLAVEFKPGETIVINGATGNFGSAGVAVALAMGASCVIATGRNEAALNLLEERYGGRVRTVVVTGDAGDTAKIKATAQAPIDVVLDILPPQASINQVKVAILAVRPGGRIALMGGVGMGTGTELSLPYPWLMRNNIPIRGQWMYPREAIFRLVALVKSGMLDTRMYDIAEFPLTKIKQAIEHAATTAGPFAKTVLRPTL